MESSILIGISNNIIESPVISPSEISSLVRNLNNCVESSEASSIMKSMDDEELYALCFKIVESIAVNFTCEECNNIAHTTWNILCWLRDSLSVMMYITKFNPFEMIIHDLNTVSIYQIITRTQLRMVDIFEKDSVHYGHAIRYLSVLNEILIEKGVS